MLSAAGVTRVEVSWKALGDGLAAGQLPAPADIQAGRELLGRYGLRAAAFDATGMMGSPAEPLDLERALRCATELGANVLIVPAGTDDGESARDAARQRLRQWGDMAAERGVVLGLETMPGLCGDSRGMFRSLQEVNHAAVKMWFDTGRYVLLNPGSSSEVALQRVAGRLAGVRLTDHTGIAGRRDLPPLGQGTAIDFARTLEILRPLRFAGPCSVAFDLPRRRAPATLEQCRQALEQSLKQLRRGGWFDDAQP